MHLGLDFDNTIVNYDSVFYQVAKEKNLIPFDLPVSKLAVRDYLREVDQEHLWTLMQSEVYGSRMMDATPFPGVIESLSLIKKAGVRLTIVSHKTRYPYLGERYDLHSAAREWIHAVLGENGAGLIDDQDIYFEETKEAKLKRIQSVTCNWYVDDLPEILTAPLFPDNVQRILFDPHAHHPDLPNCVVLKSWHELNSHVKHTS